MKLLLVILTLAISTSCRNFGGISGSPIESALESNQTETVPPTSISSKENDGANEVEQQSAPAPTESLSPWSAWMNLKAPPAAFLKPKKKPFPPFSTAPGAQVSPLAGEVPAPWVAWTKLKAPTFALPTAPFQGPAAAYQTASEGDSELPQSNPEVQPLEAPWTTWTKLKAPPAFVSPSVPQNTIYSSPNPATQPVESPWAAWTKLKVPLAMGSLPSAPLLLAKPVSQDEYPLNSEVASSLVDIRVPNKDTIENAPVSPESEYFAKYLAQPIQSAAVEQAPPTEDKTDAGVSGSNVPIEILQAYLNKMFLSKPPEKVTPEETQYFPLKSPENNVYPASINAPIANPAANIPPSTFVIPQPVFSSIANPIYQQSISPPAVLSPYQEFIARISETIPSTVSKPVYPPTIGRVPLTNAPQSSILPEEMPLARLQDENFKAPSASLEYPIVPAQLTIEEIFEKATPSEKALLLNPSVIEFIKLKLKDEKIPPKVPTASPVNPVAYPFMKPVAPSPSFISPTFTPVNFPTALSPNSPQASILPEEISSILASIQADKFNAPPASIGYPIIPAQLTIEEIFEKATPSEKALLLNPAVIEFIKLKLKDETIPPKFPTISPVNKVAYPYTKPVASSPSFISPTFPQGNFPTAPFLIGPKPSAFASPQPIYPFVPPSNLPYGPAVQNLISAKYISPALGPKSPIYSPIQPNPPKFEIPDMYQNLYQPPLLAQPPIGIQTLVPSSLSLGGTNKTALGLVVAEDKLLVKWAKKIFEMQKNNTWIPTNKTSIIESAWTDWLKLHNLTNSPSGPIPMEPIPSTPPTPEEIQELIQWLETVGALPTEPEQIAQLIEWLGDLEEVQATSEIPMLIVPPTQLQSALFPPPYPFPRLPTPMSSIPAFPSLNVPEFTKVNSLTEPPTTPEVVNSVAAINDIMKTAPPEVKAYWEAMLATNNIPIPPSETSFQFKPFESAPAVPYLTKPEGPKFVLPAETAAPLPATFSEWLQANIPAEMLATVTSIPLESEATTETALVGLEELTPAQFSIVLKKILEQCNKTTLLVPKKRSSPHNEQHDSSEEVEQDINGMKRALYPSQSLDSPTPAPASSKLDFVPQELWDLVPTVAPNTTILDPGYWAAKKSMFISKLFDALARVTLNYTNAGTTTENPKQKLMKQIDTVLLSDAARSIKGKEDDSTEMSTDDEDLVNSDEPENLPKEPENPLHKLFKFGVQKTILSDISTTNSPQPPPTVPTTTSVPATPSLDKQKLLLEKLKSAYKSSKKHHKESKKTKSKSKKPRKPRTTVSPIDFEELAKALLVQPSK